MTLRNKLNIIVSRKDITQKVPVYKDDLIILWSTTSFLY